MKYLIIFCLHLVGSMTAFTADDWLAWESDLKRNFIGVWESQQMTIDPVLTEFENATNLVIRVYSFEFFTTNDLLFDKPWAKVTAEFIVKSSSNKECLMADSYFVRFYYTNIIALGPKGNALNFSYVLTNNILNLKIGKDGRGFNATLRKVTDKPGTPRFLQNYKHPDREKVE